MIDLYSFNVRGEVLRAVGSAVIAYVAVAISDKGLPTDQAGWIALAVGAIPIMYAAIRVALNYTPITPPNPPPPTM